MEAGGDETQRSRRETRKAAKCPWKRSGAKQEGGGWHQASVPDSGGAWGVGGGGWLTGSVHNVKRIADKLWFTNCERGDPKTSSIAAHLFLITITISVDGIIPFHFNIKKKNTFTFLHNQTTTCFSSLKFNNSKMAETFPFKKKINKKGGLKKSS